MSSQQPPDLVIPDLDALSSYLVDAGWTLLDQDHRTSAWSHQAYANTFIVLPAREDFTDADELGYQALRVLSWCERRDIYQVAEDVSTGGVDGVSVRLHPEAPSGQASLGLIKLAIPALRDLVAASASATTFANPTLVLPARRPAVAESFADRVRISVRPGSLILNLSLPLLGNESEDASSPLPESVIPVASTPFGRRVQLRMQDVAVRATEAADAVSSGKQRLEVFGSGDRSTPNATELASLASLGGRDFSTYELLFSRSPRWPEQSSRPFRIAVTPGQQRIMNEAAEFLRLKQPRPGVVVTGLVINLSRTGNFGPGDIVVYGPGDDTEIPHKFRAHVDQSTYDMCVHAHQTGLQVSLTGDLEVRGTRRTLVHISEFYVIDSLLA